MVLGGLGVRLMVSLLASMIFGCGLLAGEE